MKRGRKKAATGGKSKASVIAQMITWFDDLAELKTVNPDRIQRKLKNYEGSDIDQIWKQVKPDVDRIIDLPLKSKKMQYLTKVSLNARTLSIFVTAGAFIFLLVFLYFGSAFRSFVGPTGLVIAPGAAIAAVYITLMISLLSTRRLNRTMRTFYSEHSSELSKQKAHLKDATQILIDKLAREIYSHNLDPRSFKFNLSHTGYRNISIVRNLSDSRFVSTVRERSKKD